MRYVYGEYSVLPLGAFEKQCGKLHTLKGGGGFLGLGPAPSAPPPPDYRGAARETAAGNLEAARAALAGSLISQKTPYGALTYSKTGTDEFGNPMYTAETSLTGAGQQILDQQNKLSTGLAGSQDLALGYVNKNLANPFDTSALPTTGFNPQQSYQQAIMSQLAPQLEGQRESLEQQLANQGITPGSKAYERAQQQQNQREATLLNTATTQGLGLGLNARQQALQEQAYLRNEPVNLLSSLRTGSQVTNPSFVNTPQQQFTAGPDMLGAATAGYNAQMGDFNARQAAQANANQGFGQMAQIGLMALSMRSCKHHINRIGETDCGMGVYSWVYLPEHHDIYGQQEYIGFMADEVKEKYPQAIVTIDGLDHINYLKLGEVQWQLTAQ